MGGVGSADDGGLAFFDRSRTSNGAPRRSTQASSTYAAQLPEPHQLHSRSLLEPAASRINYAVDWGELVWRAGFRQQALGISPMWLPSSSRMTFVRVAEFQRTTKMPRRL